MAWCGVVYGGKCGVWRDMVLDIRLNGVVCGDTQNGAPCNA